MVVIVCLILISSIGLSAQDSWSVNLKGIGTFSSPRVTDLNGDGTDDIIIGAGGDELQSCDSAVLAFDGRTGELLWRVGATDQIFGSAALLDVTGDKVMDVFIGGRSAEFMAIDGKLGRVLWRFDKTVDKRFGVHASTPVAVGNRVYSAAAAGGGHQLIAFE